MDVLDSFWRVAKYVRGWRCYQREGPLARNGRGPSQAQHLSRLAPLLQFRLQSQDSGRWRMLMHACRRQSPQTSIWLRALGLSSDVVLHVVVRSSQSLGIVQVKLVEKPNRTRTPRNPSRWTKPRRFRDREAPGSNPGPPTSLPPVEATADALRVATLRILCTHPCTQEVSASGGA